MYAELQDGTIENQKIPLLHEVFCFEDVDSGHTAGDKGFEP